MITQEYLKSILEYNIDTGDFTWKVKKSFRTIIGSIAGTLHHSGYRNILINRKSYISHRLAFLYVYGNFPILEIDHINGIKDDNRLENLRECTRQQNSFNKAKPIRNSSGYKGVSWHKSANKYIAQYTLHGKSNYIGLYNTAEEASKAYQAKAKQIQGIFYYNEGN